MVHPLFASPHNAGGGSYADRDVSQLEKIREEDLAKATKRLKQLQDKLEKLESRKRKPKTYEEDVKKLQAGIAKAKKLVERYRPKSESTWKGIDIADASSIALKIDKETKEKETGAAIGNVVNQEITRLMDPEAEARAAEKRQALEQSGHKQPPKPPPAQPGPCSECADRQKGPYWCEVCGLFLCDWHRQNHERTKQTCGHCVLKIGGGKEERATSKQRARSRGQASKKQHYPRVGPNLDDPTDTKRFPNQAYNGQLPYPIPPRTKKYAGEYEGDFDERGVREGSGRVLFPNGDVYTGKFKNGMRQGFGTYVYHINKMKGETKPRRYEGQWQQSEKKGSGKETWPDGSYYHGEYLKDKFHGKGTHYNRRTKYIGEFREGLRFGKGKCEWLKSKDTYDGEWISNRMHGFGTYIYGSERKKHMEAGKKYDPWDHVFENDTYKGEWIKGKRSGRGVFTKSSGEQWDGEWKNGYRHGMGTIRYRTGKKRDGVWRHDALIVWNTPEYFSAPPSDAVGHRQKADVGKAVGSMIRERAVNAEPPLDERKAWMARSRQLD